MLKNVLEILPYPEIPRVHICCGSIFFGGVAGGAGGGGERGGGGEGLNLLILLCFVIRQTTFILAP